MLKAAGNAGYLDYKMSTLESITAIKRAGASAILTYHALEIAEWLNE
jgi:porphobilinogen synthase